MATRSRIRKLQTGSSNRTSFSSLKQLRSSVSLRGSGLHSAQPGSSKDATAIVPGRIRPSSQGSRAASAAKSRTRSIRGSSAMQRSLSTSQGTASHASLRPSTSTGSVRMGMVRSASSASATGKNQRSKRGRPASAVPRLSRKPRSLRKKNKTVRFHEDTQNEEPTFISRLKKKLRKKYGGIYQLRQVFRDWDENKDGIVSEQEMQHVLGLGGFDMTNEETKQVYAYFDKDGNGTMEYDDFINMVYREEGPTLGPQKEALSVQDQLKARLRQMGSDYDEIETKRAILREARAETDYAHVLHKIRSKYNSRSLRSMFKAWDTNKDGVVSKEELGSMMEKCGIHMTPKALDVLFDKFDKGEVEGGAGVARDGKITHAEFVDLVFTQGELKQDGIISMNAISNENAAAAAEKDKGYGEGRDGLHVGSGIFGRTAERRKEYLTSASKNPTLTGKVLKEEKLRMMKRSSVEKINSPSANNLPIDGEEENIDDELQATLKISKLKRRLQEKIYRSRSSLREMYLRMDVNHRGRISYADFRRAAADLNLGMNHHEIECLMTIIDVNNDGYISLGELRTALGDKSQNDFMSATRVSRTPATSENTVRFTGASDTGTNSRGGLVQFSGTASTASLASVASSSDAPALLARSTSAPSVTLRGEELLHYHTIRNRGPVPRYREPQRAYNVEVGVVPGVSSRPPERGKDPASRTRGDDMNLQSPYRVLEVQRTRLDSRGKLTKNIFPSRDALSLSVPEGRTGARRHTQHHVAGGDNAQEPTLSRTESAVSRARRLERVRQRKEDYVHHHHAKQKLWSANIDFSSLDTDLGRVPTRRGMTPIYSTQNLLISDQQRREVVSRGRESQQYGKTSRKRARGMTRRPFRLATNEKETDNQATINFYHKGRKNADGESVQVNDKLRRSIRSASRLERMKRNRRRVEGVYEPLREIESKVRDARVRSIIGHRVRYYEALQARFDQDVARQSAAGI